MNVPGNLFGLTALVALHLSSTASTAQDWPQWMGENRDSVASGFSTPDAWPEALTQQWSVDVGNGVATPALVGDHLYVFTRDDTHEIIRCLSAQSGTEIWSDRYEAEGADGAARGFAGPRSSPTVINGKVLTIGVRGMVSCLDAASGEVHWRNQDVDAIPRFYTSSSPLIIDDVAIAQLGSEEQGVVLAFDLESGEQRWRWTGEGTSYGSLNQMTTTDGATLVIVPTVTSIVAINAENGLQHWETPFVGRGRGGYNSATPMVKGETLVLSGSGLGTRMTQVALTAPGETKPPATELWANEDNSVRFNTPIAKGNVVYGISESGELFCINAETHETVWTAPTVKPDENAQPADQAADAAQGRGGDVGRRGGRRGGGRRGGGGAGYGSIVDAGDVLFALTPSAELIVFEPSTEAYNEIARYKVADGDTYAYPVISGNRIYIKDGNSVKLFTIE